jgi:hypothetical protein
VARLRATAERLAVPKSRVVREAIREGRPPLTRSRGCALAVGARLWTPNTRDFRDLPGPELLPPR